MPLPEDARKVEPFNSRVYRMFVGNPSFMSLDETLER